jgi:predicted ATPase
MAALIEAERLQGRAAEAQSLYRRYAARLGEQFGVEPSRALRDTALAPVADAREAAAAGPGVPAGRPGDPFIGRRQESAEALALLSRPDCRALTLLGPGGIGKSRLARELTGPALRHFPGGVHLIALQDASAPQAALARIGVALGIRLADGEDAVPQLQRQLPPQRHLLVLDNVEHLAAVVPDLQRLLDSAPRCVLMLTSRRRPLLRDAWLLPLAGLAVPDEDSRDLDAAGSFDAVRLFQQRAGLAQRGFDLASQLDAVIDIVGAVDGMPLAIELAAAWVRLLPPAEIARALRESLDLLERDPASAATPARVEHVSLRAVLDHTWTMLAAHERQALAALSVFAGGFTRAAAMSVAGCAMPLLSSLADNSLLSVDDAGRFAMHPVVRAHAADQLARDPAQRASTVARHAEHHARQLAALAPHARGDVSLLLAELNADESNAIAAWTAARALERDDLLADMVRPLWGYFENLGRHREGIDLLTPALATPLRAGRAAALARARLGHGVALLHFRRGEHAQSLAVARSALPLAEGCGDTEALIGVLVVAGSSLWQLRDEVAARQQYERALVVARERGDLHGLGYALGNLAQLFVSQGELAAGEAALREALDASRAVGDVYGIVSHLLAMGGLEGGRGQPEQACRHLNEAGRIAQAHRLPLLQAYAAINLGHQFRAQGDAAHARKAYERVLVLSPRAGISVLRWTAELALARLDVNANDVAAALPRLRAVAAEARPQASTWHLVWAVVIHGHARVAAGEAAAAARAFAAARATRWLEAPYDEALAQQLAALPAAAVPARPPTLEEALDELLVRPPAGGNGEETPAP